MGIIGKDFKYKIIKNFLSKDEIDLLSIYGEIKHRTNIKSFDFKQNNNWDTYYYGDAIIESILIKKKDIIEKEVNLNLLGTYAYWRMYTKFSELKKHKDREACEISVTVNISSDGTKWPIYMDGEAINLNIGDAAVYLGCEVEHWREPFLGDYQMQAFLHYVNKDGKNKNHYKDKRIYWGLDAV